MGASPPRILLTGREKSGKSSFFAGATVSLPAGNVTLQGAPNPIFIQTEDGLRGLNATAFPLATTYSQVIEYLSLLIKEEHDYKTVVLDSADWLERLLHRAVIEDCSADIKVQKTMETAHGGYGKAYGIALGNWANILRGLDRLNREKGMLVGIICHSQIVRFDDPNNEPYDRYELKLHQPKRGTGARDMLTEWADIVAFADAPTIVSERKTVEGKKIIRAQAVRGQLNRMHLREMAAYVAGNRYNLPDTIDLSWEAFAAAMETATGHPLQGNPTAEQPNTKTD